MYMYATAAPSTVHPNPPNPLRHPASLSPPANHTPTPGPQKCIGRGYEDDIPPPCCPPPPNPIQPANPSQGRPPHATLHPPSPTPHHAQECVAYEDAEMGVRSAQAAGFLAVIDVTALPGHPENDGGAGRA